MTTTIELKIDVSLLNKIQTMAKQERRTGKGQFAYLLDLGAEQYRREEEVIRNLDRPTREQGNNILQFPCRNKGGN